MPTRQQLYQDKATECEHQAKRAKEPPIKAGYLELAKSWRQLAEQAGAIDQSRDTADQGKDAPAP